MHKMQTTGCMSEEKGGVNSSPIFQFLFSLKLPESCIIMTIKTNSQVLNLNAIFINQLLWAGTNF
jgi:hypothetical protein